MNLTRFKQQTTRREWFVTIASTTVNGAANATAHRWLIDTKIAKFEEKTTTMKKKSQRRRKLRRSNEKKLSLPTQLKTQMTSLAKRQHQADANETSKKRRQESFDLVLDGKDEYEDEFFHYIPNQYDGGFCRQLISRLKSQHKFAQSAIRVFGRDCLAPRKEVLLSTASGIHYKYSGAELVSEKWSEEVGKMCGELSAKYNVPLNSVLVNWYRNGEDCVGRHSDDEKSMEHQIIITVSLGTARKLRVYSRKIKKDDGEKKLLEVSMQNGSVHIQKNGMQKVRKHEVPKEKRVLGERISLTFRMMKTQ
jgi:alkylated DNA repair dioxygenase AlkB